MALLVLGELMNLIAYSFTDAILVSRVHEDTGKPADRKRLDR